MNKNVKSWNFFLASFCLHTSFFLSSEILNYIIVVQIDDLLSRLDSGEKIDTIIKEERRRLKKKEMKKMDKNKKLKLLEKKVSLNSFFQDFRFVSLSSVLCFWDSKVPFPITMLPLKPASDQNAKIIFVFLAENFPFLTAVSL